MRRDVRRLAIPLLLLLASCAGPRKIDRINHGTPGYTMLRGRVALPRGQHEKTNCGPETVCAALNYLGIAVSIDEAERAVYKPAIKGATSVDILDFARRKGAHPEISDDGGLWKLQDHLEADQPVMIEVTRGGYYHFFLVAGLSRENRTVVFADYDNHQLEMGYDDLIAVWQPARFRSITFTPARAEKLEKQGREFLEGGRYPQAEERFNEALKLQADYPPALKGLGRVRIEQKRLEEARDLFERALPGLPDDAGLLNDLSHVLLELKGDAARAKKMSSRCVDAMKLHIKRLNEDLAGAPPGTDERIKQDLKVARENLFYYFGTLAEAHDATGDSAASIDVRLESLNWPHLEEDDPDARGRRHLEIARTHLKMGSPDLAKWHAQKANSEAKTDAFRERVRKEFGGKSESKSE